MGYTQTAPRRWRTDYLYERTRQEMGCTCDACLILIAREIKMTNLLPDADTCWQAFNKLHMQGKIDFGGFTKKAFMAGMFATFGLLEILSHYDGEPDLEETAVAELEAIRKDVEHRLP